MADRVELAFRRAASATIPDGSKVVVAVSGGGDSVALLHLLHAFAPRRGWMLTVAHLDHGLRRGSAADRRFVETLARGLGLPCFAERREVASLRRRDESPEEAARRVRRAFLLEAARSAGAGLVALGHTLDDQAETILMRLARGAGPTAVAGMTVSGPGPFVRPLLDLERAELRDWLGRRGRPFRDDPTNRSGRHERNRVRRLVVPALAAAANPRAARHIVEAARRLREDAAWLDAEAARRLEGGGRPRGATFVLQTSLLRDNPLPLAARIVRLALERAGCDPRRISSRHVEAVLRLTQAEGGSRLDLPSGRRARLVRGGAEIELLW